LHHSRCRHLWRPDGRGAHAGAPPDAAHAAPGEAPAGGAKCQSIRLREPDHRAACFRRFGQPNPIHPGWRPCTIGLESTIVDLRDARRPVVLRPGAITAQQISEALGTPVRSRRKVVSTKRAAAAPGMLARHYSPRTPVVLHGRLPDVTPPDEARVHFRRADSDGKANTFHLSEDGSGRSAARRLFGVLRDLDRGRWRRLHIELAPDDVPLAAAI